MPNLSPEGPQLSYEDVAKMVDAIPDFDFDYEEMYNSQDDRGYIPILGEWFHLSSNFFKSRKAVNGIRTSNEYHNWNPKEIIEKDVLSWREHNHAMPYFMDKKAKEIIDGWYGEGKLEENFRKLHKQNVSANVVRLLTHEKAPACRDFAIQCMKFVSDVTEDDVFNVFPRIGGDGNDGAQFWTVGPYIFEALKTDRFMQGKVENDDEDFLRVLMWMKRRIRTGSFGYDAEYPGIGEDLALEMHHLYLARDGFHPIHKFIGKVGEHIASHLEKIPVTEEMIKNAEPVRMKRSNN